MPFIDLIIFAVLIAASFTVPVLVIRLAPRRTGPVPDTEHLTAGQQRGIRRRFMGRPRFWTVSVTAVALATGVTSLVYLLPARPGLVLLAAMLGVPYVLAVAAILYLLQPLWHRTVTDELKRLGELRTCPVCGYDVTALTGVVCPECGRTV